MKKLISAIPIAILISILLFDTEKAFAYTWNYYVDQILYNDSYKCAVYVHKAGDSVYYFYTSSSTTSCSINGNVLGGFDTVRYMYWYPFVHREDGSWYLGNNNSPNVQGFDVVVLKGSLSVSNSDINYYSSLDNFLNPPTPTPMPTPTPEPTWYGTMWETLQEELGNPEFWFGEWFIDIIDQVFNNDEDEPTQGPSGLSHSTHIKQVTPVPTPTSIPYSTITVPRTDIINNTTVYETQYVYTSSSGDTIIATSPPTNTPSENPSGGSGGGGSEYNPIDPYSIPEVSWFTSADIGDTSYDGIDSIMQGFDSIDTVGEEYTDGMSVVEDSMGTLPTSWLLLIGIAAAIPLIAGIISRFLS